MTKRSNKQNKRVLALRCLCLEWSCPGPRLGLRLGLWQWRRWRSQLGDSSWLLLRVEEVRSTVLQCKRISSTDVDFQGRLVAYHVRTDDLLADTVEVLLGLAIVRTRDDVAQTLLAQRDGILMHFLFMCVCGCVYLFVVVYVFAVFGLITFWLHAIECKVISCVFVCLFFLFVFGC